RPRAGSWARSRATSARYRSRSAAPASRPARAEIRDDLVDRLMTRGQHGREGLEDVDHVVPDLERDVDAGLARPLGDPGRVVEQRLGGAGLDVERRQAREV